MGKLYQDDLWSRIIHAVALDCRNPASRIRLLANHRSGLRKAESLAQARHFCLCARSKIRTWDRSSISRVLYQLS